MDELGPQELVQQRAFLHLLEIRGRILRREYPCPYVSRQRQAYIERRELEMELREAMRVGRRVVPGTVDDIVAVVAAQVALDVPRPVDQLHGRQFARTRHTKI